MTHACVLGIITKRYANGARSQLDEYFPTGSEAGIKKLRNILNTNYASDPYIWAKSTWRDCCEGLIKKGEDTTKWKDVLTFWTQTKIDDERLEILDPETRISLQVNGVFNVRFNPKDQINTSLSLPLSFDILYVNQRQIGIFEWGDEHKQDENLLRIGLLMSAAEAHWEKIFRQGWQGKQVRGYGLMTTQYKEVAVCFGAIDYLCNKLDRDGMHLVRHIARDDFDDRRQIWDQVFRFAKEINYPKSKERFLEIKRKKRKVEITPVVHVWNM